MVMRARRAIASRRILVEGLRAWRQLHPWMAATVVHGHSWRRKGRVAERADRNAHRTFDAHFRMEHRAAARRAETEHEARALVAGALVFGGGARDGERRREARERSEHAAGASLALEAVTQADAARLAS